MLTSRTLWAAAAALAVGSGTLLAQDAPQTFTYKQVDGLKIQADVYRAAGDEPQPVPVYIHGGALNNGSRTAVPRQLRQLCREHGYALVSLDYRLAPEAKLPEIIADIKDAFRWIRGPGSKAAGLNSDKLVVSGGSAGGYLTMMTGICVNPKPNALVAYWGYGDVDGTWYTEPSEHYRTVMPLLERAAVEKFVHQAALSGTDGLEPDVRQGRGLYYRYLRQNGLWTKTVTGFDPRTERKQLDPYCPVRNITADYPPIMMIHGTVDTDVPYELSANMAAELKRHGVEHELITVPDAGHGLSGGDRRLVNQAHERALAFIREQLDK